MKFRTRNQRKTALRYTGSLRSDTAEAYQDCCADPECTDEERTAAKIAAQVARAHHIRVLEAEIDPDIDNYADDTDYENFTY